MSTALIAFVALLCGALYSPLHADEPDPGLAVKMRDAAFRALDKDGDGWVSRKEAAADPAVARNFDKADKDRDGRLSPLEFQDVALNRSDQPGKFSKPDRG